MGKHHKILYTYSKFIKLYRNLSHPSTDKLFNLLKIARPCQTEGVMKEIIEDIATHCNTCQRFTRPPICFKVSFSTKTNVVFGEELSMDLKFLDGKAILNVVDADNHLPAATFLDAQGASYGQTVDGTWLVFAMISSTMYTGYPNRLRTDQGSIFT